MMAKRPLRGLVGAVTLLAAFFAARPLAANPPNVKVVLEAFYWDCKNADYQTAGDGTGGWYTYLAKLCPRLKNMGVDGIWVPPPCKAAHGTNGMGYDLFDHYDLGQKFQAGDGQTKTTGTRFGDQDALLRLIAVAHANGLEVYPDIVLNHMDGGALDPFAAVVPKEHPNDPGEHVVTRNKLFNYACFTHPSRGGRWPKTQLDFHPNPDHAYRYHDDWVTELFGPDICYRGRCTDHAVDDGGNSYMRRNAREWFVWLKKLTDADGFRFDAVKHFPPEVVEDLLFNAMDAGKPDDQQRKYFAVGEYVSSIDDMDRWADGVRNRAGTFDYAFRDALSQLVQRQGLFDMGSLPNFQQRNRLKTVPFVNNHDTWRGVYPRSSGNGKNDHEKDLQADLKNRDELAPTIDPDDPRAKLAYAAIMAVDGSPQIYYEDLFNNENEKEVRDRPDPDTQPARDYVTNLIWCHQKLNFKDGAYKVRFQGSPDLLIIERSGKAVIVLNDDGSHQQPQAGSQTIDTDFGPNARLHDYSGTVQADISTNAQGRLDVPPVPPMGYCVWGPVGVAGGFAGHPRRTTQEFQLDDDLGDSQPESLRYGGKVSKDFHTAGAVWAAAGSTIKVQAFADDRRNAVLRVLDPAADGAKSDAAGQHDQTGVVSRDVALTLEFKAPTEGYYQLLAKLADAQDLPARAYIKVEYEAPAASQKIQKTKH
jgi:alpha-amylase